MKATPVCTASSTGYRYRGRTRYSPRFKAKRSPTSATCPEWFAAHFTASSAKEILYPRIPPGHDRNEDFGQLVCCHEDDDKSAFTRGE